MNVERMTEEAWNIAEYILRSFTFQGNVRTDVPDGRLFGPRASSKDPLFRGVPEGLLESIIEFTFRYERPPTFKEFSLGCMPSQPHPAWTKANVSRSQNKILNHEWSSPDGTFTILDTYRIHGEEYLRVSEKSIAHAASWQEEMRSLIGENGKGRNLRYLNSILRGKDGLQEKLEELRAINRTFFNGTRSVRVRKIA